MFAKNREAARVVVALIAAVIALVAYLLTGAPTVSSGAPVTVSGQVRDDAANPIANTEVCFVDTGTQLQVGCDTTDASGNSKSVLADLRPSYWQEIELFP